MSFGLGACEQAAVPELRIGINPWPGYEYLYLAAHEGLFDTSVVRVQVLEFADLSDTRRAFERGQLDGFASSVVEVLQARDRSSRRPVITLVTDQSTGADQIVARARLNGPSALRHRRIGVEMTSLNLYLLARALLPSGNTLSDVTLVPVEYLEMASALRSGEVDAVVTYPPASLEVLEVPGAHIVFSTREIPAEIYHVISVDSTVLAEHAAAVAELSRGIARAWRYAEQHPESASAWMAGREGISPQAFVAAVASGLEPIRPSAQGRYLRAGGRLDTIARQMATVLGATHQLARPAQLEGMIWRPARRPRLGSPVGPPGRQP